MGTDHTFAIKIVARYDQDKNRQLTVAELRKAPIPRDWRTSDKNKDGELGLAELGQLLSADREKRGISTKDAQRARLLVSRYDRNADFQFDADDLKLAEQFEAELSIAGGQPNPASSNLLAELSGADADKNGKLTVRELENHFAQHRKDAAAARGVTKSDEANAAQLLFRYDTNRNRRIVVDETDNPPVGVAEITILTFIEFDEDFDEQLTQAELAKFLSTQRYKENVINKSKE
jgi:hypothetical protein